MRKEDILKDDKINFENFCRNAASSEIEKLLSK